MVRVHLALGSNLGDRLASLRAAVAGLAARGAVVARSSVWRSEPVDMPAGAGEFLNAVLALETALPAPALLEAMLELERRMGRVRDGAVHAPRTIDLDLLLAGDLVIDTPELVLPHPRLHERAFVLVPLVEIAPDARHPLLHRTMADLLAALPPGGPRLERLDAAL